MHKSSYIDVYIFHVYKTYMKTYIIICLITAGFTQSFYKILEPILEHFKEAGFE